MPRFAFHFVLLLMAAGALLGPISAGAQPGEPNAERTATARALFEEGLALLDDEQWAEAADRFERAQALRPSPQITYNLTSALIGMGELVRASELLLQLLRDPDAAQGVRDAAAQRRDELEPRIGRLVIEASGDRSGAEVFIDDRTVDWAAVGVAVPVDPGDHTVRVRRGDQVVAEAAVRVAPGAQETVSLDVPAAASPRDAAETVVPPGPAAPPPTEEGPGLLGQWWFWVGAVVVVGAVVAGVLLATGGGGQADPVDGTAGIVVLGEDG